MKSSSGTSNNNNINGKMKYGTIPSSNYDDEESAQITTDNEEQTAEEEEEEERQRRANLNVKTPILSNHRLLAMRNATAEGDDPHKENTPATTSAVYAASPMSSRRSGRGTRSWSFHDNTPFLLGSHSYHEDDTLVTMSPSQKRDGAGSGGRTTLLPPTTTITSGAAVTRSGSTKHARTVSLGGGGSSDVSSATYSLTGGGGSGPGKRTEKHRREKQQKQVVATGTGKKESSSGKGGFFYYIIYAIVNVIISAPGLYGYAAVIFNNDAFQPHMNALSKLVIFSSLIHQLGFCLFSGLPFAIGTVQDAGLIFLSAMANIIANTILNDGGAESEVLSTTLVLLSLGTACLGVVLILMGKFHLADAVSYLPMPVVGGYLAFIGYFCLQAGVALCVSEAMVTFADWAYLFDPQKLLLAFPGLATGLLLTWISRKVENDAALPLAMVIVPALFYAVVFGCGIGLEEAREGGWVGEVAPPVPLQDLFHLVDFSRVKWHLIAKCLPTWTGMVFVVSFASCLDVAAISMDMGEALDTNKELATVGICNFMSGMTFGFTGSYIFSQTIFTYRTGVHSRWIGVLIMIVFMSIVASTVNFLQVAPLFFLGSTLIFIGYDLLYEWLIEVRHKIFLSEYIVLLASFVAIQIIGIDFGIIFGVIVAVVDHVFTTARVSSLSRVSKRSRAVWKPEDWKLLQNHGYHPRNPKIVTLEITGSVFFGSSLNLLSNIVEEIGLDGTDDDKIDLSLVSPHNSAYLLTKGDRKMSDLKHEKRPLLRSRPSFVVLDLTQVPNLDASAARGCFLQLSKMAAKRGIVVCAAGTCPRVDWMLRSHDVAYGFEEEERIKDQLQNDADPLGIKDVEKVILFLTVYEALEFCENQLIEQLKSRQPVSKKPSFVRLDELVPPSVGDGAPKNSLVNVFSQILGLDDEQKKLLRKLGCDDGEPFHEEAEFQAGEYIYRKDSFSDGFFVVLKGTVAVIRNEPSRQLSSRVVSGAGEVKRSVGSNLCLLEKNGDRGDVRTFHRVGGVFGFVDSILDRPRLCSTAAVLDGTVVARFSRGNLDRIKAKHPDLDRMIQGVLIQASVIELANCTCFD